MTLLRSDGDGYFVISDLGKIYYLDELKAIGADKTTDKVVITSKDDRIVDFFYGASSFSEDYSGHLDYIKDAISKYEADVYKDDPVLNSEVLTLF